MNVDYMYVYIEIFFLCVGSIEVNNILFEKKKIQEKKAL